MSTSASAAAASRPGTLITALISEAGLTSDAGVRRGIQVGPIEVGAVLFVTTLTALAAQISVPLPFTPVPSTLQPIAVLVGAAALGARLGAASQALYLLLGLVGLPVFAASGVLPQGAGRLIGPTAGFLLSYPIAAFVTGWLAERRFDRKYLTSLAAMAAGLAVIFTAGALWFAFGPTAVGLGTALSLAVVPFLPADLMKLVVAAGVLPAAWRLIGGRQA